MTFVLAHRGSTSGGRENTIPAFQAARDLGAAGVELDVHLTRDGLLVVHHDPEVPGLGAIATLDSGALPEWLPTLAAALEACGDMEVIVEVKAENAAEQVVADVADRPRTWVSSFKPAVLEAVGAADGEIRRALLWPGAFDGIAALALAESLGCAGAHPYVTTVTHRLVDEAHGRGMRLDTWTVNEPARVVELARWGVDGIMTDDVAMAVAALR